MDNSWHRFPLLSLLQFSSLLLIFREVESLVNLLALSQIVLPIIIAAPFHHSFIVHVITVGS
jgi:hypothetical protein